MSAKKCNCKKCGLCRQVYWTSMKKVNCKDYGDMPAPTHCDKFITIADYETQQVPKNIRNTKGTTQKYFWQIINEWEGK